MTAAPERPRARQVHPAVEEPGETIMDERAAPAPQAPPPSTAPPAIRRTLDRELGRAIPRNRPSHSWATVGGTLVAPTLMPDEWVGPPWPPSEYDDNGSRLVPGTRILVAWVRGRPVPVTGAGRTQAPPPPPVPVTLAADFTVPIVGATAACVTVDSREFAVGQWVYVQGAPGFWGSVTANDGATTLTLLNEGSPNQAAPGAVLPTGNAVSHGGPEGKGQAYGQTTALFTVPALNGTAPLVLDNLDPFTTGQWVYVENTGWFRVTAVTPAAPGTLTVRNEGSPGNLLPGAQAPIGAVVTGGGPKGDPGMGFTRLAAAWAVPALGASSVATVESEAGFAIGQWVYVEGGGWFSCTAVGVAALTLMNNPPEPSANQPAGTPCAVGALVNGAGPQGQAGTGATTLLAPFTVPAVGASAIASVASAAGFINLQWAYVQALGWFVVVARDTTLGAQTLELRNDDSPGNSAPATVAPLGAVVTGGGPAGAQGIPSASPTTADFVVPGVGLNAPCQLEDARGFALDQWAYVTGGGWFKVIGTTVVQPPPELETPGTLTLRNDDSPGNAAAGTMVNAGILVTGGGPSGRGLNGYSYLAADFTMPAVSQNAQALLIDDPNPFAIGQWVFIQGCGWLIVTGSAADAISVRNDDSVGNTAPGTVGAAGNMVTGGGPQGYNSWAYLTAPFTVPAVGTSAVASMEEARSFAVGQWLYVQSAGWFVVEALDAVANTVTLLNEETVGNQAPGTVAPVLSIVTGGGPKGDPGRPSFTRLLADFPMPAALAIGQASVEDAEPFAVGQVVYVEAIGYLRVNASDGLTPGLLDLENLNYTVNELPGTVALTGDIVTGTGPQGPPGYTWLAAAFTMPAVGATGVATVRDDPPPFSVGQWVHIEPLGWLMVTLRGPGPVVELRNDASPGNAAAGATAPIDTIVTVGGPEGAAYSELTAQFTMPAVGASVVASVLDARPFGVDSFVFVEGAGYFELDAKDEAARTLTLINRGIVETAAAGDIIPAGNRVITGGAPGIDGLGSASPLAAAFTMPAVGASATATVERAGGFSPSSFVHIQDLGYFELTAKDDTLNTLDLLNRGMVENAAAGAVAPIGNMVSTAGAPGVDGRGWSRLTVAFAMPAPGAAAFATVERADGYLVGQWCFIAGCGWLLCQAVDTVNGELDLLNLNSPGNSAAGATAAVGEVVNGAGPEGRPAWSYTTADFVVPDVGLASDVTVEHANGFAVGSWAYLPGGGWFVVQAVAGATETLTLENAGSPGNAAPATTVAAGTIITGSGPAGRSATSLTAADFAMPDVGMNTLVSVQDASPFGSSAFVFVEDAGYFECLAVDLVANTLDLLNRGFVENAPLGQNVPAGSLVATSGPPGVDGIPAASPLTAAWTSPAVGASAPASVQDARGFIVGQWCYVEGAGPYYLAGVTMTGALAGDLDLRNDNQPGHVAGSVCPVGAMVNGAAPAGVAGAGATPLAADWAVPAVGAFSVATVFNGDGFGVGQWVYVQRGGYFVVMSIGGPPGQPGANSTELRLLNRGTPGNSAPGAVCPLGMAVTYAGPPGPPGGGYTVLTAPFTVPALNTSALASVEIAEGFAAGQWAFVEACGWFSVLAVDPIANTLDLSNLGSSGNQQPGYIAPTGAIVNGSGPGGLPGVGYTRLAADWVVPALQVEQVATCDTNEGFGLGQWVFVEGGGWHRLTTIPADGVSLGLTNVGAVGNPAPGTTAAIGAMVNGAGPEGDPGFGCWTRTIEPFVWPNVGATTEFVNVENGLGFAVGQWFYFEPDAGGMIGWAKVTAVGVDNPSVGLHWLSFTNAGSPGNAPSRNIPNAGVMVNGSGPEGKPAGINYVLNQQRIPPVGQAVALEVRDLSGALINTSEKYGVGQLVHVGGDAFTGSPGMYGPVTSVTDPGGNPLVNWMLSVRNDGHRENGAAGSFIQRDAPISHVGPAGPQSVPVTTLAAEFAMPAVGANGVAQVRDDGFFAVGNFAYVEGLGYFETEAVNGRQITLINRGFIENASPGVTAPVGARANTSGPIGAEGAKGDTFAELTATVTMPPVGGTVDAVVDDVQFYAVGMVVYLPDLGYLLVQAIDATTSTLTLANALDTMWLPPPGSGGLPPGGVQSEVLTKLSAAPNDANWLPPAPGFPAGGAAAEVLTKASATDHDAVWAAVPPTPLPPGGAVAEVLTKQSATDGDAVWAPVPPTPLPPDGAAATVLTKLTATDGDADWRPVPPGVPNGGATAEVLTKVSGTDQDVAWAPVPPTPLPPDGAVATVLTKITAADGDADWRPVPPGVPPAGAVAEVLTKQSATDYDAVWAPVPPTPLPPNGATATVLTKLSAADGDADWRPAPASPFIATTAAATMPPAGGTVDVPVSNTAPFAVGMTVFVEGLGYLNVTVVNAATSTLTLEDSAV